MERGAPDAGAPESAALLDPVLRRASTAGRRGKRGAFRRAQHVVVARAIRAGLVEPAPVVAIDATGFEARHVSLHYRIRRAHDDPRRTHQHRAWPKLTTVAHIHSHLILGAVPGTGPTNDSPDLPPALRQAAALLPLDTVLADAAYDAEPHHRLCRDTLGIPHSVIALNPRGTRRWPTTPYRRALRRQFPWALYHQRWHAESVFSRHKRRLGSALRARSLLAQARELVLRVLTHNLMILWWPRRSFQQSTLVCETCSRQCFSVSVTEAIVRLK